MEKLAKVLKAVLICHDENSKCSECPYDGDCAVENGSSRMLQDAADLYMDMLTGNLACKIVQESHMPTLSGRVMKDNELFKLVFAAKTQLNLITTVMNCEGCDRERLLNDDFKSSCGSCKAIKSYLLDMSTYLAQEVNSCLAGQVLFSKSDTTDVTDDDDEPEDPTYFSSGMN